MSNSSRIKVDHLQTSDSTQQCTVASVVDTIAAVQTISDLNVYEVKGATFVAELNHTYWVSTTSTVTLPSTVTRPPTGSMVNITKAYAAECTINVGAGVAQLRRAATIGNFTAPANSVLDVKIVYNGTDWEVQG